MFYKVLFAKWIFALHSINIGLASSFYSDKTADTELFCNQAMDRLILSDGKKSAQIFDLHPGLTQESCKRKFVAPESHGFFIRLNKINFIDSSTRNMKNKEIDIGLKLNNNSSESCPLIIYSSIDPLLPPWRIDPCQLERNGRNEEPVRILPRHLRIIWNHYGNIPSYRLSITVLGKGPPCMKQGKHSCLKFGDETLLCISQDLICDGIRHCPAGVEYDSDEDFNMCEEIKKNKYLKALRKNYNLWEHISMEAVKNLFDDGGEASKATSIQNTNNNYSSKNATNYTVGNTTKTKANLTRGLSRYGPWGYLMLGMLLCGAALLICGLWECCCRRQKSEQTGSESADISDFNVSTLPAPNITVTPTPPNYDELDPPPSYSILYPNSKISSTDIDDSQISNDNDSQSSSV